MNCPNCNEPLSERGFFCKACAAQVRCMKCRDLLEPGANACVECGTRLGQAIASLDTPSAAIPQPNRNTLSYQEDRNNRRFEASLTDTAMNGLGDVFGELFAQRGVGRTITQRHARTLVREETILDNSKQLPPGAPPDGEHSEAIPEKPSEHPVQDKDRIQKIFNKNGESLELIDNRLKATTRADYQRRLTHLFLFAQEIHGRVSTPRKDLMTVLKNAKVYDTNLLTWLRKKVGFSLDGDDRLKLIAPGREQAIKTLNEILDSNIPDNWNPDSKIVKSRGPRKKI